MKGRITHTLTQNIYIKGIRTSHVCVCECVCVCMANKIVLQSSVGSSHMDYPANDVFVAVVGVLLWLVELCSVRFC